MDAFTLTAQRKAKEIEANIKAQQDRAAVRYVFAPFANMFTSVVPNGDIPFGTIVPIGILDQPVGRIYLQLLLEEDAQKVKEFFNGPNAKDFNQNGLVGRVEVPPTPIVDELISRYAEKGAIQVKTLYNTVVKDFLTTKYNDLIFAGVQCRSYEQYLNCFQDATIRCEKKQEKTALKVIKELEVSVNTAYAWARREAEMSNQLLGKPKGISEFVDYHYRLFEFTGVTPRDQALNQMALNQDRMPEILERIAEGSAMPFDPTQLGAAIAAGISNGLNDVIDKAVEAKLASLTAPAPKEQPAT